jgi:hypothetical protein
VDWLAKFGRKYIDPIGQIRINDGSRFGYPRGPVVLLKLAGYLFPEQLRAGVKTTMERLSDQALDAEGVESIVLFARGTERWDVPYEAVLYAKKR